MAKRMPTVKELEAARKTADKVMLTSILANASKTVPKAAEGKTSAPSSAGLTVKPAATTTPVPPTVLPKVNSLGLLNPEIVNKYLQQGMAYAKQGPQSRMDIANSLLDFDIGDYKKGDVAGFNYDTMQEMNIRNRYFIGQHQRAGTFDFPEFLTDEYIAFPSTDYLTKQNDAVMVALEESKAKDAAAAASKEQNADQEVAWQNLYKAKQEEKDFFDEWYNLLLADHLLNNSGQIWDFEAADARYGEDVMDDVTYEAELKRLREQMQGVDWATKTGYNTANYESQTPALQAKYDLISGQLQNRNKAAELEAFVRSQPDFDEKRRYVDNNTAPEKGSLEYIFSNDAFVQGLDDPLRYMHSDVNWASRELAGEYSGKAKYYFEHGYHLMAPEQLDTYTYLYQSGRYKEAADYIAAIQPELNKAMSDIVTEFYTTRDETIPGAIIDSLWSVPGKIKGTLDTGAGILMGKDDPNDPLYRTAQNVDTIRDVSGQTAGELLPFEVFGQKAGTFLYGLGMSTLDMIAAQKLAGIFGVATGKVDTMKNIMGAIMATEAGTDTFRSDLERGMGFEYSLGHGIANGLVNRWAESGFLDNLFSENGKFLTKVLKSGASEGLEEVFESGMNLGTDAFVSYLTGKQNEVEQTYNYYVATVGKDKAAAATMQHYANQFAADGLAGFIMGGTTSTAYNTGEYLDTRAAGKAVTKDGDIDTIMGIAKGMAEDSESKRIADEITGKQGKGKKPSFYQFGQLTKALVKDLGAEHADIINRVQDEAIVERLVELGEDRTAAKQNASIIRRIARGEKVPRQEMFEAKWSDNASQVVKELTRETKDVESFAPGAVEDVGAREIGGKWVEGNTQEAEANRTGNKWVTDMQNQQRAETENVRGKQLQVQVATVTPIGKAANRAEEAAKKRVPKRDGKPKLATDSHVTFRGADGSAEISGDIMRFEESDEGMQVVVQTGKGKEGEQKAKLEDWISADGDGVATILSYIGDEQLPHSVTAEEANTLMQVYKHSGGNAKEVIQAFDVNYLAGYSGNNQVGSVLDPALSKIAYENGKRDAEKDEAQRKQRASEYKALENPVAGWIGKVDGREQVKGLGDAKALEEALQAMPESQRTAAEIMIETGKAVGLNVVLYDSDGKGAANDIQNGMFDAVTHTVYYDVSAWVGNTKQLQAMKKQGTLGYAMLRVGGHELTHYLEVAAPEAYAKYSKAVKDALKAKGVDFAVQMRERIDKANAQGRKLTMAGAAADVIADASENMLQDSKLFNSLDTDTKGKIRAFLQNFAQKVKEIFQHLTGGHKESAALRKMKNGVYHYMEGLQDLWDAGFDEILAKGAEEQSGDATEMVEGVQYSDRDLPDGVTIREYLGSMKPTSSMTETEKLLLKRYQDQLRTMEEKEKLVEEQEEIIRTAPFRNPDGSLNDEITKAKNRYKIYRDQANRAARALANAEKDEGFARLMATSRQVVNDYLLGAAGNVADAQDVLESEINELTRQLTKLEADVTRTSQGQRTAFARGLYNPDDLKAAAQKLKDTYGSRMSVQNIANRLALAYGELYANDGAEGGRMFMAASRDLATDLLAGNKYRYQSEILPMLREQIGTISLSDTDLQEIGNAGLTVTEYKRVLSPYIKVSAEGSDLSSYASNAEYYGNGALAAVLGDENEGNLAMRLYDVISQEKAKEADNGYDGMNESQLIGMAMADIAGANLPMSANSSTVEYLRKELLKYAGENAEVAITVEEAISKAKKATAKAGRIWLEAAKNTETARQAVEYYRALDEKRRVMELAEQKKQITEQLKSDTAKKLQEKVTAQREEYREREKKAREYRKARVELDKVRKRISRNVKAINALRVRETDKKHVPQQLQYMADLMMQTFTDTNLGRLAFPQEKLHSLSRTYRLLLSEEVDATHYWDDEIEAELENLVALSEAYNGLKNKKDGVPSVFTLEGVEYETEILRGVDNVVANILNMIDAWNDNFLRNRTGNFETFANQTGEKLRVHDDYKVQKGWRGKVQTMLDETIRTGNMTPVYFFDHLHNQELLDVFGEIREGMHKAAMIEREGKEYIEKVRANRNYGKWVADGKLKMKTGNGHIIELTREEACEIYAIAKREAANKLYQTEHLLYGGFQYKHIDQHVAEDGKTLVQDIPNQLDAADLEKIGNWLTAEQKAYADDLVGFLSTTMADYGNAASMEMYGYNKFTENYYIPFKTVAEQRYLRGDEGPQGENAGTGRLLNSGFTHKVQYKANATLYVGGISETVAEHIHKMAAYSAMVQPIENLKRVLNHKVLENDGTSNTIRALIGQKYGKAAENYMTQLLKDLNGATQSDQRASAWTDMMVSAFKRGAVMASASVVLQQPTAMARAMAMISPKYFTNNPFYRPGKGTWEEMLKHSGTAVIKDMGKFDVGMGKTASQYILDEDLNVAETYQRLKEEGKTKAGKAVLDRFIDWLTAAPGVADQWTWGLIWKAVKAEQAALHPNMDQTSDEFLDMVGKRFDEVVDHTQVYDSVLTKSNLMRSQNGFHKMATSFMAEPTLSINMLYDALTGKHGKKQAARIIGSVAASQVLAGALAALVQAWNDDDDERNWLEKYADRASSNIFSNINVFGMIPYISDIVSLFEGYDVERPDLSMIADLMDYTQKYFKAFADGGMPSWKDTENFVGTLANLAGVPAKNISREIRRTRNAVFNTNWNAPDAFNVGQVISENTIFNSGKNKEYYQRIVTADLRGDVELAENLREYMLTSKMVTPDTMRSGIKTALKEAYIDGDTDDDTAIDMLMEIGAYENRDDAYWEVDKWKYMQETGASADSYSKYNDFYTAVETGEDLKKTIQEYLDNGASKSTLAGKITSQYKPQMIALKESGKGYADLQARILTAYEALGYDRQEKLKDIQKWFKTDGKK